MKETKCDIKNINLSFSLEYVREEIIKTRNKIIKFYEGGMTAEYLNTLTIDELLLENKVANDISDEIESTLNNMKKNNKIK